MNTRYSCDHLGWPGRGLTDPSTLATVIARIAAEPVLRRGGTVTSAGAGAVVCEGLGGAIGLGDGCWIARGARGGDGSAEPCGEALPAEVTALGPEGAVLLAYGELTGVQVGTPVVADRALATVRPSGAWLGRVVDALGRPIDGGPELQPGSRPYPLVARALPAHRRGPLGPRLDLGVRALDLFTPCREGQRLGVFAGSGVGKSSLMAMIARASDADAIVVGLIGERGRELREFLEETLGADGRARSVVVAATSDLPAMMRRRAAYLTMAVAEALRDEGLRVLCLLDSVTRFAMALREVHLASGEPPATRGYPPSVFAELPRLLERAGPGPDGGTGSITGVFTVLVEGDDTNEPIADSVRGILDGHVVLDRKIAERGRFPAIDVPRSLSRATPGCYAPEERELVTKARRLLARHGEMAELVQLGAYKAGADALLDEAILRLPEIEAVLAQPADEPSTGEAAFARLEQALSGAG